MAKKELRIYFNLENENEKMLYEHLMKRTSASGYLKDIALDYLENRGFNLSGSIAEELKNINTTLSNLSVISNHQSCESKNTSENNSDASSNADVSNVDVGNIDIDSIDFSDINLD